MARRRARLAGFTLAEVMVALVLLSIAALGLVSVQIYALGAMEGNRQRQTASVIAASEMARLESLHAGGRTLEARPRAPVEGQDGFEMEVREAQETGQPGLQRIEVEVFWSDDKTAHSYLLWTWLYARGVAP